MILLPHLDIPSGFRLGKIPQEFPFQGPVCSLSWTTSCATSETRSPRRTCRRCSPRSATLRMRTASSPTCPSWTGSLARPKNPTKLQSQASRRPWQHGTLLKKISQIGPMPPQAARLLRILGGLTRQSEGRWGNLWSAARPPGGRPTPCCATQPQRSRPARSARWGGWPPARFSTASPLLPAPALAALLSQHHSHFLASPVGYLYERGDR